MEAEIPSNYYNNDNRILPKEVDIIGLSVYGGIIVLAILYVVYTQAIKLWRRRNYGDPILKGALRWAAAAGDLKTLEDLSLAPEFEVESATDGFTALHAAVVSGKRGEYYFMRFIIW
jgi:hypothetical protein